MTSSTLPSAAATRRYRIWPRVALAGVLSAFLLATGLFNVLHPIWESQDEPLHYEFVRYLWRNRALPVPVEFDIGGSNESHQPPLYYALEAVLVGWTNAGERTIWHVNPFVSWPDHPGRYAMALHHQEESFPYRGYVLGVHLGRLVSSLLCLGTVALTYLLGRALLLSQAVSLGAAALVAFNPGFALSSATVSNSNGVVLASALVQLHCVRLLARHNLTWRDGAMGGLLLAIAVLTKLSGLSLLGLLGLTWTALLWRGGRTELKRRLAALAPLPLVFVPPVAWWLAAQREHLDLVLSSSGMRSGGELLLPAFHQLTGEAWREALLRIFATYWGSFGWAEDVVLPLWLNAALAVLCGAAGLGMLVFLVNRGWRRLGDEAGLALLLLAGFSVITSYLLISRWAAWPVPGMDNGRHLYPALPALGVFGALGLAQLPKPRLLLAITAVGLLAVTLAVPFTISRTTYPPPMPAWASFDESVVGRRLDLSYQNGVTLLGFRTGEWQAVEGGEVVVNTYWRAERDQREDFWAAFRLVDYAGRSQVALSAVPQLEQFPPSRWLAGEVVPAQWRLRLPPEAPPGPYRLQVRVLDRFSAADLPLASGGTGWLNVAQFRVRPNVPLGAAMSGKSETTFGERLELAGYEVPTVAKSDGQVCVSLYWRALAPLQEDYQISVQLLDSGGRLRAQHDGPPGGGRYPMTQWDVAELVPDQHCLQLVGVQPGTYRLVLAAYSLVDGQRLAPAAPAAANVYYMTDLAVKDE